MRDHENHSLTAPQPAAWNKGKLIGAKPPLRPKHVWSIRTKLQIEGRTRDLAMFNVAIDSKLRGSDVVAPEGRGRGSERICSGSGDRASKEDRTACQVRIDRADPASHRRVRTDRRQEAR